MPTVPRTALLLAAALLGAIADPSPAAATQREARQQVPRGAAQSLPPADGEVIVRFRAGAATLKHHALGESAKPETVVAVLAKRAGSLGQRVGRTIEAGEPVGDRMQVVRQRGADAAELARQLAADPEVEFAVPNGRQRRLQVPPNDPLYAVGPPISLPAQTGGPVVGQWYLRQPSPAFASSIGAEVAWLRGLGSASVVVAVLDTGVRFEHPDLGRAASGGRLLPGYDFVTDPTVANDGDGRDDDPSDAGDWIDGADRSNATFKDCDVSSSSWHGTATASLVGAAANNGVGMVGAAPGVQVLPVRVLGKCFGKDSDIQAAMRWAAGITVAGVPPNPTPAKVINMSLGSDGACSAAYQAVVDEVVARGVVIVAAAGNSAGEPVGTPASCNGVIAVSALRHVGTKVGFSDLGAQIAISAPGGNCVNIGGNEPCLYPILAALNAGLTAPQASTWSDSFDATLGTSFASPLVAGVVGLMYSQDLTLSVARVRAILQATARLFPETGGSANSPACAAPVKGAQQLECYCPNSNSPTYPLCGAGMLDAGAAVNAAALGSAVAAIEINPTTPLKGQSLTLSSAGSTAGAGRTIVGRAWSLVSGNGAVNFTGATDGVTATMSAGAAGTIVVRLTLTDDTGAPATSIATFTVVDPTPASDGGKGGGALSLPWLVLLALAAVALVRRRREAP